jgi:TRAP-type C4-dicarboxylate transport system substrate-binding protein
MTFWQVLKGSALAAALVASPVAAQTWDMPVPYGDTNFHTLNGIEFAKDVEARTGGKISITVHPSGSLFKHPEIKNAVRSGQVPLGEILLSRLSNENPMFELDSVPFLATSYDEARKLWEVSKPKVEEILDKEGLMVLYAVPWPPQGLYADREIPDAEALKGLKFRAYNVATERMAQLLDMVPAQVEVADLAQAFATGRVDSMITSPSTGYNSKAWDYLSHYYDVRGWMPKNAVLMNKRAFRSLDEATQTAILEAAAAAEERGWAASVVETEEKTKGLADNGIVVAEPSDALRTALMEVGATMTEEWLANAGDDGKAVVEAFRN